jgi:hypothetical protein
MSSSSAGQISSFRGREILQTCLVCSERIELYAKPKKVSAQPVGHFPFSGGFVEMNYPIHLGCIQKIEAVRGQRTCPVCPETPGFYFILNVKVDDKGQTAHLSTITQQLWTQAKREAPISQLDTGASAVGMLIRGIERASSNLKNQENLTERVEDALTESRNWDPYALLLFFAVSNGSLPVENCYKSLGQTNSIKVLSMHSLHWQPALKQKR